MSDRHEEIECYECGRLKTRLIWKGRCVTCTLQRLEFNLEENERLKARVAELEKSSISRTLLVDRLQEIPDLREMNLHDAEIIWSILEEVNDGNFDFKEPDNEG